MKTKVLIYCTKKTPRHSIIAKLCRIFHKTDFGCIGGKIVAECEVECEHFEYERIRDIGGYWFDNGEILDKKFYKKSCLTYEQLNDYLETKGGYALHISNLKTFDEPKKLTILEYAYEEDVFENMTCDSCMSSKKCKDCYNHYNMRDLTKAPQNMKWVWYIGERYCLISIRPEWVAKILKGEKTIEVRKKVLKGMIQNEEM